MFFFYNGSIPFEKFIFSPSSFIDRLMEEIPGKNNDNTKMDGEGFDNMILLSANPQAAPGINNLFSFLYRILWTKTSKQCPFNVYNVR